MITVNQKLQDLTIHHAAIDLMRVEAGERKKILKLMKDLEKDIVKSISDSLPSGFSSNISPAQRKRLTALLTQTRETIKSYIGDYSKEVDNNLKELAILENKWVGAAINEGLSGVYSSSVALSEQRLSAIASKTLIQGKNIGYWWKRQENSIYQNSFLKHMRMGMLRGETLDQIVKRVTDIGMPLARNQVRALVGTAYQEVTQAAQRASYKEAEEVLKGYQYLSTLDDRTTEYCKAADGALLDMKYAVVSGPAFVRPPPNHMRCRSVLSPITKSFAELNAELGGDKKEKFKEHPEGAFRASMDGRVPKKLAYTEWLSTKSSKFQNEVLGKARAQLFRDGKITHMANLLDQSGNPLTIKQLTKAIESGGLNVPMRGSL